MNTPETLTTVAYEVLAQLNCELEHLRWLSCLGRAIHQDVTGGTGLLAKDLGALVPYLADNRWVTLEGYTRDLRKVLEHCA